MSKRVMIDMPATAGIKAVLAERSDVEYDELTERSEDTIVQQIGNIFILKVGILGF